MPAEPSELVGTSTLEDAGLERPGSPRSRHGATLAACAAYLDLTRQRVAALANDGNLPRKDDGTFDLDECRVAYIRFLRQAASRRVANGDSGAQLREARAREIELRVAKEIGELIPLEDVTMVMQEIVSTFCAELNGLPTACTRDLDLRNMIENQVSSAIDRCRTRLEEAARLRFMC
ncbi:hypothetical protein XH96_03255 [Bradyrhizobium sp. CCBAU 51765]|nr:hypothetical protein XH96_03255 [Bradyrhizobium sp. CCBAU 51765]